MTRTVRKAEVEQKLQVLLGELTPRDNEKKHHFERRVVSSLRKAFKRRLNTKFFKAHWFKNAIQDRFQKCNVISKIKFDKFI